MADRRSSDLGLLLLGTLCGLLGCEGVVTPEASPVARGVVHQVTAPLEVSDAGDETFVRRLLPILWGRHPSSLAEVELMAQAVEQLGRRDFVLGLTAADAYRQHWGPLLRDLLAAERIGARANEACYRDTTSAQSGPELAAWVREHGPEEPAAHFDWTMADLVESALRLDDVSVVFRTHAFANLNLDYDLPDIEGARAARESRVDVFLRTTLGRRLECLDCHHSEGSVTDAADLEFDRFWPIAGPYESLVFDRAVALRKADLRGIFRRRGVVAGVRYENEPQDDAEMDFESAVAPFGMAEACGLFIPPASVAADDLDSGSFLAGTLGNTASVWDLEAALRAGLEGIRGNPDLRTAGRAEALGWLAAASFVDQVFEEVTGRRLTIEHGFARNDYQRNLLEQLTRTCVSSGYSLAEVLAAIASADWFNAAAPSDGSSDFPAFLDPWIDDAIPNSERTNTPGTLIHRWSGRVLMRSVQAALELTGTREFPLFAQSPEVVLGQELGVYFKEGSAGFRTVGFQGLLAWEHAFAACEDLSDLQQCPLTLYLSSGSATDDARCEMCRTADGEACGWDARCCDAPWDAVCPDDCLVAGPEPFGLSEVAPYPPTVTVTWFDRLLATAGQSSDVTVGDLARALKNRILAEPTFAADETVLLEAAGQLQFDSPFTGSQAEVTGLRRICGVFLQTPDFMMSGVAREPSIGAPSPKLVVVGQEPEAICDRLAPLFASRLVCQSGRFVSP
ncbi:MAG: hypothetical protein ACI9OJ_005648 [Myxococcota bacterium]|jgi:hypothetical protein